MRLTLSGKDQAPGTRARSLVMFTGAVLAALAIIGAAFHLDQKNSDANRATLIDMIGKDVTMVAAAVEHRLSADLAAAEQLRDTLRTRADTSLDDLSEMADRLMERHDHIASVGLAPGYGLHSVRPAPDLKGDTRALTRQHIDELKAARDNGSTSASMKYDPSGFLSLAVPMTLGDSTSKQDWGALALTLHKDDLMKAVGLTSLAERSAADGVDLVLTIRQIADDGKVTMIHGPDVPQSLAPVVREIPVPGGKWQIIAVPAGGWDVQNPAKISFRVFVAATSLMLIVPIFFATLLLGERNRNIATLRTREEKLVELSQRFDLAMNAASIGVWEAWEPEHRLYWDDRSSQLHGCAPCDKESVNRISDWQQAVHPDDMKFVDDSFRFLRKAGENQILDIIYRVRLEDGSIRHLRLVSSCSTTPDFKTKFTGIVWDVTSDVLMNRDLQNAKETSDIKNAELELALDELSSREHELAELSHKFDLALASYNCGIWEADLTNGGAIWDERMHQLYGLPFSAERVTEEQWLGCIHPDDRRSVLDTTNQAIRRHTTLQSIQRILLPDGDFRYVRSVGQVHTGRDGNQKIIGIAFDVTADVLLTEELKVAKEEADARNIELELTKARIEYNSLHDPLTSLGNRRKIDMELDALSRESQSRRIKFAILHLDLDRFKTINDTLGHAAGDAMLVHASQVLMRHVRRGDIVARIGGDEFVILATETSGPDALAALSSRIIEEMSRPVDFEGFQCRCGVSIGIAQAHGTHIDARKILVNADIALYQAKEKGRNGFQFFTHELQANIVNSKRMADEMLAGLERDEFTVWYQPQYDASTMHMTGAEALVRWNHPERGVLPSGAFLKTAEELNVMARIDQLVLELALRDKMRLTARGIMLPKISVNVSSKRLHDEALIDSLTGLALSPGEICFELVESIFLDDSDDVTVHNIERIKALGIDIEIDDFGTGHTSIVSLLKLKPKRLKIDRQLVMPILDSPQERTLVRSIIDIARSLGIESVAEGVETPQHAHLLRELGCDILQGFAFAKPLSFDEFVELANTTVLPKAS
ncbi:EAL domain-containing protein [Ciceribacter sp. L1K22]|uniref:bifunctional diguanylate cyclase/phosphodiesterase n=1 Tax=Ciceribacter sp. L1K22 TaxID=2820275 RepID=UPI0032B124E0